MSGWRGHLGAGLVAGGLYTLAISFAPYEQFAEYAGVLKDWQPLAATLVLSMLFSLFPDVDTKSKGQGIFYWAAFLLDALLIWQGYLQAAAYLGLVAMLPLLGRHRGWTHSMWAVFIVPLPLIAIPYLYSDHMLPISVVFYGAAAVGYVSHLFMDGILFKRMGLQ